MLDWVFLNNDFDYGFVRLIDQYIMLTAGVTSRHAMLIPLDT